MDGHCPLRMFALQAWFHGSLLKAAWSTSLNTSTLHSLYCIDSERRKPWSTWNALSKHIPWL